MNDTDFEDEWEAKELTYFKLTARTAYNEYEECFEIPLIIADNDWEEVAKMIKQVTVILAKLPVDPSLMGDLSKEIKVVKEDHLKKKVAEEMRSNHE